MLKSSYETAREEFYRLRTESSDYCSYDYCDCYDCREEDYDDDADCFCG